MDYLTLLSYSVAFLIVYYAGNVLYDLFINKDRQLVVASNSNTSDFEVLLNDDEEIVDATKMEFDAITEKPLKANTYIAEKEEEIITVSASDLVEEMSVSLDEYINQ